MATTEEYLNENDTQRLDTIKTEGETAVNDSNAMYDGMIADSDQYYQGLIDTAQNWADTQTQIQNEQTDFAIEQIEQQKDQAKKDYTKEQSGAYTDWQKQSQKHGVNAEQMAANGMTNTGFSESSQVSMYNTYQNRVATARESYNRAVLNYDNAIKDARLQNNAKLAEIAYNALQQQLELSLQGFQYKNNLLTEKSNKALEISQMYHTRYTDMLNQINTEKSYAEDVRQFDETIEEQKRQHDETIAENKRQFNVQANQWLEEFKEKVRVNNANISLEAADLAFRKAQADIENAIEERKITVEEGYLELKRIMDEWERSQGSDVPSIDKGEGTGAGTGAGVGSEIATGSPKLDNLGGSLADWLASGNYTLAEMTKMLEEGKLEEYYDKGVKKYRIVSK